MYTNIIHTETEDQYQKLMVLLEDLVGLSTVPYVFDYWNNYRIATHIFLQKNKTISYGSAHRENWPKEWISSEDFIRKMKPKQPKQQNLNKRIIDILEGELSGK